MTPATRGHAGAPCLPSAFLPFPSHRRAFHPPTRPPPPTLRPIRHHHPPHPIRRPRRLLLLARRLALTRTLKPHRGLNRHRQPPHRRALEAPPPHPPTAAPETDQADRRGERLESRLNAPQPPRRERVRPRIK